MGFLKFVKTIDWEMGFGQNLGWENGIYTPLQDPHEVKSFLRSSEVDVLPEHK